MKPQQYPPYQPKGPYFTPQTDKINYLAQVAALLDKRHAPKDPAWILRALNARN